MIELNTKEEILEILEKNKSVLLYFGATNCGVCEVLKPKIEQEVSRNFSKIKQIYINSTKDFELSSYFNIFTAPTILVFFEKKEFKRYGRNISLNIFNDEINRLYEMVF
jgi:thioredoxin 1